jgi:hypothetical protein
MIRLAAITALAALISGPVHAGSLDNPQIADYSVWSSNRCYKPPPPPVNIADALSYNLAVDSFNRYFAQMKTFMDCIGSEANQDYEALRKALETGLARARSEALTDLEQSRSAIEAYRGAYAGPALNAEAPPSQSAPRR